jgi:hypothetical protein
LVHWLPFPEDVVPRLEEPPNRKPLDAILPVNEAKLTSRSRPALKDPAVGVLSSGAIDATPGAFVFVLASRFKPGS